MNLDIGVGGLSASGAAGGGNVFNSAPLFGNYYGMGGSSNGSDGAGASASADAKSPGSTTSSPVSAAAASAMSQYGPYLLLAGGAFLAALLVKLLFFHKSK